MAAEASFLGNRLVSWSIWTLIWLRIEDGRRVALVSVASELACYVVCLKVAFPSLIALGFWPRQSPKGHIVVGRVRLASHGAAGLRDLVTGCGDDSLPRMARVALSGAFKHKQSHKMGFGLVPNVVPLHKVSNCPATGRP